MSEPACPCNANGHQYRKGVCFWCFASEPALASAPSIEWLREAFDGDSVPAKNIALRKAHDILSAHAQPCQCGELQAENEILRTSHRNMQDEISELREALEAKDKLIASMARRLEDVAATAPRSGNQG